MCYPYVNGKIAADRRPWGTSQPTDNRPRIRTAEDDYLPVRARHPSFLLAFEQPTDHHLFGQEALTAGLFARATMDRNEAVRNRLPHHEPSKSLDD